MEKHYNILIVGISHQTASIAIREKLAFTQENIPLALKALYTTLDLEEMAVLSTCNRTELYCRLKRFQSLDIDTVIGHWQRFLGAKEDHTPYIYAHSDECAVKHILRVASGLDSMILGEPQILGQLKTAYQTANHLGVMGRDLSRLFQLSFRVAKKIRGTTGISTYPVSVAYAAVTLAKQIFSDLSSASVVLIGAGENTELILQHLLSKQIKKIVILNRTLEKGKRLAKRFGVAYDALGSLPKWLSQADIIVSSIACEKPILSNHEMGNALQGVKRRPLLMIDLGVPRNISPDVSQNEDIYLYSVDDLEGIISQNKKHREKAAIEAECIVQQASEEYVNWLKAEKQRSTIRGLRLKADKIKREALDKAYKKLENGEDPKQVVELMLHQLTQKLLHQPTVNLRKTQSHSADEQIAVTNTLFDLE